MKGIDSEEKANGTYCSRNIGKKGRKTGEKNKTPHGFHGFHTISGIERLNGS